VREAFAWAKPDGCHKCRPALNYYLLCAWPGEYGDDAQSRFVNERVHANIQKDGTYSVIPRMWGGLTTAKELRAIADVAARVDLPIRWIGDGQAVPDDLHPSKARILGALGLSTSASATRAA